MSALKNSVRLTGYLGFDPEIVTYGDKQKMARVSLATHEKYRNKEAEWITDTHWHTLTYWGKNAEYAEKTLKKGNQVSIEGRLVSRNYTDKEGITRYISEIIVNDTLVIRVKVRKEETGPVKEGDGADLEAEEGTGEDGAGEDDTDGADDVGEDNADGDTEPVPAEA